MRESFLHHVWQYRLFSTQYLQTASKKSIIIKKSGNYNTNSGPDFLNAQLKIDDQLWVGNVEIHLKSSDWYLHRHELDANYDAIILHVVWEYDTPIFMKNNKPLPTLVLKGLVNENVFENYQKLFSSQPRWIPCQNSINTVDSFVFSHWKERLFLERLERKTALINDLLSGSKNDYEAVLFQLLAKNFGLKVNGDAFLRLARQIDFSIIRKEQFQEQKLSAFVFGQGGFLTENIQNEYYILLQNQYRYLKHKYQLKTTMARQDFSFFRMRPTNFPTIRIAQLISLYCQQQNLFSKLMKIKKLKDFYALFSLEINDFWKTHYTFKTPSKKSAKRLTKSFIDLLLINTVIPLKFVYQKNKETVNNDIILNLIQQIKPEKNAIISKFSDLKITSKNAFETQALLEMKHNYCLPKRCLKCEIGVQLLRRGK